jgi:hypothetical protein
MIACLEPDAIPPYSSKNQPILNISSSDTPVYFRDPGGHTLEYLTTDNEPRPHLGVIPFYLRIVAADSKRVLFKNSYTFKISSSVIP